MSIEQQLEKLTGAVTVLSESMAQLRLVQPGHNDDAERQALQDKRDAAKGEGDEPELTSAQKRAITRAANKAKKEAQAKKDKEAQGDGEGDDDDDDLFGIGDDEPEVEITPQTAKKLCNALVGDGVVTRGQLRKLIEKHGGGKLSDLEGDDLIAFYKEADALEA